MRDDGIPVGGVGRARTGMAGGDGGLQFIGTRLAGQLLRAAPARPAPRLISSQSQRARSWSSSRMGWPWASVRARSREACSSSSATRPCASRCAGASAVSMRARRMRLLAQRGPHPVIAGGGRIALVEDQVDHLQHGREAFLQLLAARHFEGHLRVGQRALGAHDALGDGGLALQEGACDLGRWKGRPAASASAPPAPPAPARDGRR